MGVLSSARAGIREAESKTEVGMGVLLGAAGDGSITADWRRPRNRNLANLGVLGDVVDEIRYGTASRLDAKSGGIPVLRVANIRTRSIDLTDVKYAHLGDRDRDRFALIAGDLLMIRSNGSLSLVGRAAEVTNLHTGMAYAGYLVRIRLDISRARPAYVAAALGAPSVRDYIERTARSTTGLNNINAGEIALIPVRIPELDEQDEIVARLLEFESAILGLQRRISSALALTDHLRPRLLASAFAGQLVPGNLTDAPLHLPAQTQGQRARRGKGAALPRKREGPMRPLIDVLRDAGGPVLATEAFAMCGIGNGSSTEEVENVYQELRALVHSRSLRIEAVRDAAGEKQGDRLVLAEGQKR
jgi:type I restriction enzyme S subunit